MPLVMEKEPEKVRRGDIHLAARSGPRGEAHDDGTRQLLRAGSGTLATGILAALLTQFAFGGIGPQGPHTNSGWLALLVAMGCLPFGFLLFLLGGAKWLRNRKRQRLGVRD